MHLLHGNATVGYLRGVLIVDVVRGHKTYQKIRYEGHAEQYKHRQQYSFENVFYHTISFLIYREKLGALTPTTFRENEYLRRGLLPEPKDAKTLTALISPLS
jgi:hypothetical protein